MSGNTAGSDTTVDSCGSQMHDNALYYTFTPSTNQEVVIDATSSQMDTVVSVFSGSCTNRNCEGFNDDSSPSTSNSNVQLCVEQGAQYFIIVSNFEERGEFTLTVRSIDNTACCIPKCEGKTCGDDGCGDVCGTCFSDETCNENSRCEAEVSVNDACAAATLVTVSELLAGTVAGGNVLSNPDRILSGNSDESLSSGVWFRLVGSGSGIQLDTCNSNFDTVMRIFSGSCSSLTLIAKNDDGCPQGLGSRISFCTTLGTEYLITIDGFNGRRGHFVVAAEPDTQVCSSKSLEHGLVAEYSPSTKGAISSRVVHDLSTRQILNHDMCDQAVDLNAMGFPNEVILTDNTKNAASPFTSACVSSEASGLWYTFLGTGTTVIAETCTDSKYESIIQVISEDCLDAVCEQYAWFETSSPFCGIGAEAVFCTRANIRYWILVEGRDGQEGEFTLRVDDTELACNEPSNTPCEDALNIAADAEIQITHKDYPPSFVAVCDLIRAPDGAFLLTNAAWFRFIAPATAQYGISVCSEERFDSFEVEVYEGADCEDHRCFGTVSEESVCTSGPDDQVLKQFCTSSVGQEYHIAIYSGYGYYTLTIETQQASCALECIPTCPGFATCGSDTCGGECGDCQGTCDGFECINPTPGVSPSPVSTQTPGVSPSSGSTQSRSPNAPQVSASPTSQADPSATRSPVSENSPSRTPVPNNDDSDDDNDVATFSRTTFTTFSPVSPDNNDDDDDENITYSNSVFTSFRTFTEGLTSGAEVGKVSFALLAVLLLTLIM